MDNFDAHAVYDGDNAVSSNGSRDQGSSSLATDGVRGTLAALLSHHGLSGAAAVLSKVHPRDAAAEPPLAQDKPPEPDSVKSPDAYPPAVMTNVVGRGRGRGYQPRGRPIPSHATSNFYPTPRRLRPLGPFPQDTPLHGAPHPWRGLRNSFGAWSADGQPPR
ncbi:hypothetical protein PR048_018820 [Dryococelus australis]|uniref:Uncharacterized protein n=1 Tax=Dryococelus australis TaxID=614101 RepID=A0ABQ9H236_9NEOP|nr:hypothetical protein PR048_018820 [Dryococelus australis]